MLVCQDFKTFKTAKPRVFIALCWQRGDTTFFSPKFDKLTKLNTDYVTLIDG